MRMLVMSEFYEYYSRDQMFQITDLFTGFLMESNMPISFIESAIFCLSRVSAINHIQAERLVSMFGNQLIEGTTPGVQVAALGMLLIETGSVFQRYSKAFLNFKVTFFSVGNTLTPISGVLEHLRRRAIAYSNR